jgi:hypothetical protein
MHGVSFQLGGGDRDIGTICFSSCRAPRTTCGGGTNHGGIGLGDAITATLTLVGGAPGTATVTATTIGRTFTLAAPFQYGSALHISIP